MLTDFSLNKKFMIVFFDITLMHQEFSIITLTICIIILPYIIIHPVSRNHDVPAT